MTMDNQNANTQENQSADTLVGEVQAETPVEVETSLEDEVKHLKDQLLRSAAEQENLRKRLQKEKEDAIKFAVTSFAKSMLSVVDNIDRAIDTAKKMNAQDLVEGIELSRQECLKIFKDQGVRPIEAKGKPFDPNFHEAIAEVDADGVSGSVFDVMQVGYTLHDRLLRPSFVTIVKKK